MLQAHELSYSKCDKMHHRQNLSQLYSGPFLFLVSTTVHAKNSDCTATVRQQKTCSTCSHSKGWKDIKVACLQRRTQITGP